MLKCGAAEYNITPKLGVFMPGSFSDRFAQSVYDDLYVRALVLDDGETVLALAILDTLYVSFAMTDYVRRLVKESTGIPEENVLVAGTHTHYSFSIDLATYRPEGEKLKDDLTRETAEKTASAIRMAYDRRRDARISFGRCEEHDISFIRRYFMKDGRVRMNPGMKNPDIVKPEGVIDPEVGILRIDEPDGTPIAVLSSFACHLCVAAKNGYSADYGGEISRVIKGALGQKVVSLFFAGCCGNINHIDYTGGHPYGADHHIKMGRILGYKILSQREKIAVSDEMKLAASVENITVKRRQPTEENMAYSRAVLARKAAGEAVSDKELSYANAYKFLSETPKLEETFGVQAMRIGDIGLAGMPGEIFVEAGLAIKEQSPFEKNFTIELANGCLGYVSTAEAQTHGGYETELSRYTFTPPETLGLMVDSAVRQLKKL